MKFEEIWPRGFRREVVQRCKLMDGRRRTRSDHNSSSLAFGSGELKRESPDVFWVFFFSVDSFSDAFGSNKVHGLYIPLKMTRYRIIHKNYFFFVYSKIYILFDNPVILTYACVFWNLKNKNSIGTSSCDRYLTDMLT